MKRNIFAYFYLILAIVSVSKGTSSLCMSSKVKAARIVGAALCATTCALSSVLPALHIDKMWRSRIEDREGRSRHRRQSSILKLTYKSISGLWSVAGSCAAVSSAFLAHKLMKPLLSSPAPRCVTALGAGVAAATAVYSYAGAAFYGVLGYKYLRDKDPNLWPLALSGASLLGGTACGAIATHLFRESMRR